MTRAKKITDSNGQAVAAKVLTGKGDSGGDEPNKPALHLMPGRGLTVDIVGKMYKSITGKDMTPEDRAECEATLAAHHAKKESGL
jgi:hypothetical protein